MTEADRLQQLKQLAVRMKNRAVNRVKLGTLKQDKGEPVRKFAGRVRSLATVSEYAVNCQKCQVSVPYTEAVITDQVITGLACSSIQRDVLSHPDAATMNLEKLLQFVEGKESGQASQGLMSGNMVGEVTKPLKCKFCGSVHNRGKQFCKAAGQKCEKCGKVGHFSKVCMSSSNREHRSTPQAEAKEVKQNKQEGPVRQAQPGAVHQQVEAAWGYQDGNWACQVDCEAEGSQSNFRSYSVKNLGNDFNKYPEFYKQSSLYEKAGLYSRKKEAVQLINSRFKKSRVAHPCHEIKKEACSETKYPKKAGQPTLGSNKNKKEAFKQKKKKQKKAGQPTLGTSNINMLSTIFTIMAGSAVLSAMSEAQVCAAKSMLVSHDKHKLTHHVFSKHRGWVRQGAKSKPMVMVRARVDNESYLSMGLKPPETSARVSEGYHLADTGASICLGGKQFMRSLGLSEYDLTPCDMSVCGADNGNCNKVTSSVMFYSVNIRAIRP